SPALCYLPYNSPDGLNMCPPMLDQRNDDPTIYVPVLLLAQIALRFLMYGLGRVRGATGAGQTQPGPGQPGPGQPGPGQPQQQWAPAGPPLQQYGSAGMRQGGPQTPYPGGPGRYGQQMPQAGNPAQPYGPGGPR